MGEIVAYPSNGGTSEGYLARPTGPGNGAAVVVIQEHWGLVDHITSLADRFAAIGFVALAPDLYHGTRPAEPDAARRLLMGLAMAQAAQDIAGAAAYLSTQRGVTGGVGAVGFCMGGSLALYSATCSDRIAATVGFYPAVPWERMSARWPGYAGKSALIHCAESDQTSAADGIRTARSAIEQAGGACTVHDYPGTAHAFFNDDRPGSYHRVAAHSAWARTVEHLRARL